MKTRNGFVSNSSSSSFIIVTLGDKTVIDDGNTNLEHCGSVEIDIDKLIVQLEEAKAKGIKSLIITHGGGFEG